MRASDTPPNRTSPAFGLSSPASRRISVDFPDPFAPTSADGRPRATPKEPPRTPPAPSPPKAKRPPRAPTSAPAPTSFGITADMILPPAVHFFGNASG